MGQYLQISKQSNQKEIAHVIDESISVINDTQTKMAEIGQTVNRITGSFSNLDDKLGNIKQALECEFFQVRQFKQFYLL